MPWAENEAQGDWEITPDGLYIATRAFLLRRGHCCANCCRNCPYVNWREQRDWRPAPAASIRRTRVSPKVLTCMRAVLDEHRQALSHCSSEERAHHLTMIEHYERLLANWC